MSTKMLIVIIGVVVLIMGSIGVGFFIMWNKVSSLNTMAAAEAGESAEAAEVPKIGPIHPLDTFIVNLADENGVRYLRTTMKLELADDESVTFAQERLPLIRDSILTTLPTKRYEDISTAEGKKTLRDELITKLNVILVPGSVSNIYFTEFVVQ